MRTEKQLAQLAAARAARWAKPGASERQSLQSREMHKDPATKAAIITALHAPGARKKAQESIEARRRSIRDRFFAHTAQDGDCLVWTGATSDGGYGEIRIGGKLFQATHVALDLAGRPKPFDGAIALHSCDNPPCVEESHLEWGTQRENIEDMISKGRQDHSGLESGRRYWPR